MRLSLYFSYMKFTIKNSSKTLNQLEATLVFARVKDGKTDFDEFFSLFSQAEQKLISSSPVKPGQIKRFTNDNKPQLIMVAAEEVWTTKKAGLAIRKFINAAKKENAAICGLYLDDLEKDNIGAGALAEIAVKNAELAHYDFSTEFKTKPKEGWPAVKEVVLFTQHSSSELNKIVKEAQILADAINQCRTLCNYPPSHLYPESMAEAARTAAASLANLKVTVFDEKKLKAEGMKAILAVGSGSATPPRLVIMEYKGGKQSQKPIALVGKGITFDSGGINTKPAEYMGDMHMDMSGGE